MASGRRGAPSSRPESEVKVLDHVISTVFYHVEIRWDFAGAVRSANSSFLTAADKLQLQGLHDSCSVPPAEPGAVSSECCE